MNGFLGAVGWFVLTLGVLVTFHEFGHYWVARRCGVKVKRFSIGFGRPLWSRVAADGTRYQVGWLPLGGYVQFLDEREGEVAPADLPASFGRQSVFKRILIVLAGPVANLLLCIGLLWATYQIGWPDLSPVIGTPSGLAAEAGLRAGDRIVKVGEQATPTWTQAVTPLALAAIDRRPVLLTVADEAGRESQRTLPLDRLPADFNQANPLAAIGLGALLAEDRPIIGELAPDAAATGILEPGDRILRIGATVINHFSQIPAALQASAAGGRAVAVEVERKGQRLALQVMPRQVDLNGKSRWQLGIGPRRDITVLRYGPVAAFGAALAETGKQTRETLGFIARLVRGEASSKNLSGVIGIAQVAQAEARLGVSRLLFFMASLSLTLCIMNLLPIPVLDGGHLLYYLIELVSGRPVSERVLVAGQYAGLVLLAGLIGLAFYNDILRTLS
jgi:regulator of sigma E protease